MATSTHSNAVVYEFVETASNRVLGTMKIKADIAGSGGWSSLEQLDDILDGGFAGGLEFWFPDQGTTKPSVGTEGFLEPARDERGKLMPYGSTTGAEIDTGSIVGKVSGYDNDNWIMAMAFPADGIGAESLGNSVVTMDFGHDHDGTGQTTPGNDDDHAPKYCYIGKWLRKS